jgi:capsular exopolysaccharide synthesis family protein
MITVLAAILGLILGLLTIYLMELFDDTFSTQESVENEIKVDVVAIIPQFKQESDKPLITIRDPNSYVSESFRMCKTNISYMSNGSSNKVIMLTSSVASEGKTTTSCNLAVTIAQANKKVLLIDADLRKPSINKIFKTNISPGLSDVIYEKYSLKDAIYHIKNVPGLDILTAGTVTPISTVLLGSDSLSRIINEAGNLYDMIIIDAPPVLNVSDTVIISKLADKVLFVIAMGETSKAMIKEAKRTLERVGIDIMGIILTNMKINPNNYYYRSEPVVKGKRKWKKVRWLKKKK